MYSLLIFDISSILSSIPFEYSIKLQIIEVIILDVIDITNETVKSNSPLLWYL